jgi:hypothetical protein
MTAEGRPLVPKLSPHQRSLEGHVRRTVLLAFALLVQSACGGAGKSNSAADQRKSASTPEELNALFKREVELPNGRPFAAPDGAWKAVFPATVAPTLEQGDGFSHVSFSLGTEQPSQCFLYKDTIDAGQSVTKMLAGLRENVEFTHVAPYRIATAQGLPIVFIEGRYLADSAAGKVAGSIKLAVTPRFTTPLLCFLDEPGYAETFAKAVSSIAQSIEVPSGSALPKFSEVWAIELENIPVGYELLQIHDGGDGSQTSISLSSSFIPTGPGELSTSDEVEVLQSNTTGILKGTFLEVEGTEVSHELNLSRKGKAGYVVSGTVQGKEIKADFKAPVLADRLSFYRYLQKNQNKSGQVTVQEFAPSLDPTAPSKVTYKLDSSQKKVSHQVGEISSTSSLGASGLPEGMSIPIGVRHLTGTVIHRQGNL